MRVNTVAGSYFRKVHAKSSQPVVDSWFKISKLRNAAGVGAEIWIYDEIGMWGVSAQDFVSDLAAVNADDLTLHINSPGGDVYDGLAIYNSLKQHPAAVTVMIEGLAASAASFIAMAGNSIEIARNAEMMIHDASTIAIGNAADMRETMDTLERVSENIADIYTQRAGGTKAGWRKSMQAETWYSADAAVEAGLADRLTGAPDEPPDEGGTTDVVAAPASNWFDSFDPDLIRNAFKEAS